MDKFNYDTLQSIVGQKIKASDDHGNELDQLTVIKVARAVQNGDEFDAFCVSLEGSENEHLPQNNYKLSHDAFGDTVLFLSPHDLNKYEIIVSRKKG